jgi:hypothetical protein
VKTIDVVSGFLMLFGSFLSHEEFVSLLSILFHHPFGTTGSHSILGSFFGSVWTSIFPSINLSPGNLLAFIVVVMPNHVLVRLGKTFVSLYHPFKKSQPSGESSSDENPLSF